MATYKVTLIIKEEEKKLHFALSEDGENFVKFLTKLPYPDTDINKTIRDTIAAYPDDLAAFEEQEKQNLKKTSPVTVKNKEQEESVKEENTETTKKIAEEVKTDLFAEAQKVESETTEEPSTETAAVEETGEPEESNSDSELFE